MTQIRTLVWKDLQVHWRVAGPLILGWPVGIRMLAFIRQAAPDADPRSLPLVVTVLSVPLFVAVSSGLATMLVEQERTKETFAWLRTLPVSDLQIVIAKCATGLVFHVCGSFAWWAVLGGMTPSLTLPQAASVWCLTLVVGGISLLSQLATSGRLAVAAPIALLALGLLAGAPLSRSPSAALRIIEWWQGTWGHVVLWAACAVVYALLVGLAYARFHAADTEAHVR